MGVEAKPYLFGYSELKTVTEDFNSSHKLGEGGFGPVFKVVHALKNTWFYMKLTQLRFVKCYVWFGSYREPSVMGEL